MSDVAKSSPIRTQRPMGITLTGILFIVFGILTSIVAVMIATFTAMMGNYSHMMGAILSAAGGVFTLFIGIFAAIEFAIAWALLSGKSWGRITIIVLTLVDLIGNGSTLVIGNLFAIPHVVLDFFSLLYMWKPNVRAYFQEK